MNDSNFNGTPPVSINAQCGNCAFWTQIDQRGPVAIGSKQRGVCKGMPPIPHPQYDQRGNIIGQKDMWPCPIEDSYCALFMPRADLIPAAATPYEGQPVD